MGLQTESIGLVRSRALLLAFGSGSGRRSTGAPEPEPEPEPGSASSQGVPPPQQHRGFAALQAVVARGGLPGMAHALKLADRDGSGYLSPHDIRAVLTDPSRRNQAASSTAAGWPVVDGGDYRRVAFGEPDYRRLGQRMTGSGERKPHHMSRKMRNLSRLACTPVANLKRVNGVQEMSSTT